MTPANRFETAEKFSDGRIFIEHRFIEKHFPPKRAQTDQNKNKYMSSIYRSITQQLPSKFSQPFVQKIKSKN
jgi:hypothetical protein